ncbi:MAG: lipid A export permease/ATP-binding protein MsbA [Nitrospirae bacterium]|nr:lipid A export permease/ATP-binding protein MsbA [Nitrospirota bacterium]
MNLYIRLLKYVKPYWVKLFMAIVCTLIVSLTAPLLAYLVKPFLDDVFIRKDVVMLYTLVAALPVLYLINGLSAYGQSFFMGYAGLKVLMDIRNDLYEHIINLPLDVYNKKSTGRLMSRITNDVNFMQGAVTSVIKDLLQQGLTIIGLTAVAFYQNWRLASIAIFVMPFAFYLLVVIGHRLRKISKKGQERIADITSILQETFSGIRIVKGFGMEDFETKRFKEHNRGYFNISLKGIRVGEITSPLIEFLGTLCAVIVVYYGGMKVINDEMTAGTFFSFLVAVGFLYRPVKALSKTNNSLQQALAAAERVFAILDMPTEKRLEKKDAIELPPFTMDIQFKNVSFKYESSDSDVLSDINITIKKGEVIAFVGTSGGGKTTLVNLIPRFFEPTGGEILIDGANIGDATIFSLRKQISLVSQDVMLFNDTVKNNIAYGRMDIPVEKVMDAAKAAYAHQFIIKMPEGYDTVIGERGVRLSGGERQRIAIARAILKDSPILILDEATSSLDTESEFMVQKALENLMKNRTTFVIAHRLSTIQHADRIAVVDEGKIKEIGRHDELLRSSGLYKRLYKMQFRDEKEIQPDLAVSEG